MELQVIVILLVALRPNKRLSSDRIK